MRRKHGTIGTIDAIAFVICPKVQQWHSVKLRNNTKLFQVIFASVDLQRIDAGAITLKSSIISFNLVEKQIIITPLSIPYIF